ncbi:MAG: hypothetical protein ABSF47_01825 [Minisyncoccia bacterium]|jgi:hypothetical protein
MELSDEKLDEYIRLYKEEFKEEISRDEARKQITRLADVLQVILYPHRHESPEDHEHEGTSGDPSEACP